MKINAPGGLGQYKSYIQTLKSTELPAKDKVKSTVSGSVKTDTVSISEDAVVRSEVGRIAGAIGAEVERSAPSARIESLRSAVAAGSYFVPAEDVAAAILSIEA